MGGRGTFASGIVVPYTFETVAKIDGMKVLRGIGSQHGLPEESHSSGAYIQLNRDGTVRTIRLYDAQHRLRLEIAKHRERNLDSSNNEVLHYHVYDITGAGKWHGPAQRLTKAMRRRYARYFQGSWT